MMYNTLTKSGKTVRRFASKISTFRKEIITMMEKKRAQRVFNVKLSTKGQIVIPAEIRKMINISGGNTLQVTLDETNAIKIQKKPTALDWSNLIAGIPNEVVTFNENGTVNTSKSPNFAKWMSEDE
ncbi:AbrB/MazE/SpoVT family DNA-binding domain-containing protein [Levilactobacillus brevis]|nr:AbrB/MazE/SpoVT family DNA-binding domain-containing protein [Levilactobacillus brevis]MCT3583330.1 AbrB/MazE/SpoVT family DNA-binding domain-containing protein [Levilactobacillus brevis]